jgi:hypothetical protein
VNNGALLWFQSGTLFINASGVLFVDFNGIIIFDQALIIMIRAFITGTGTIKHRKGHWKMDHSDCRPKVIVDKNARAERRPSPLPTPSQYMCGSTMSSLSTTGTLDIDMSSSCAVTGQQCSFTADVLSIQSTGVLYLGNVTTSALPVCVGTSFTTVSGSWLSVEVTQQPVSGSKFTVVRFPASASNCVIPTGVNTEVVSSGFTLLGTSTVIAVVDSSASGWCLWQVSSTQVSPFTTAGGSGTGVVTGSTFSIPLNQDCVSYTADQAANAVAAAGYSLSRVKFTTSCIQSTASTKFSTEATNTMLSFVCTGTSLADADGYCQTIYNDITNPNSALFAQLKPLGFSSSTAGGNGSNNGLYGLLALIAIPVIILVAVIIIVLKGKATPEPTAYTNEEDKVGYGNYQPVPTMYQPSAMTPYPTPNPMYQ